MKELIYKLTLKRESAPSEHLQGLGKFNSTEDLVPLVRKLTAAEPQEVCLAFYFIGGQTLIGYSELARGGFEWVSWDAKMLFSTALLCGATSVVMVHNHPSGNARPSRKDVLGMKKLIPAAFLLGIKIVDHLVVSEDNHVSMQEFGLLPPTPELVKDAEKKREEELDLALDAAENGR